MENIEEIIKNAYTQFMKGRDDFVYECDEMNALRASVAKLDFQAKNPKGSFENNGNFHTYRNLERAIIQKSEYTVSEYYGNDSIYNIELIPVKSLVQFLQDNNCLLASMVTEPPLINKAKQKP